MNCLTIKGVTYLAGRCTATRQLGQYANRMMDRDQLLERQPCTCKSAVAPSWQLHQASSRLHPDKCWLQGFATVCKNPEVVSETTHCSASKPQCVDRSRRSNTHTKRWCRLRQRIIGVAMMSARHLAGQSHVCGCQLQSRRVQARTGRRCTTIRAATAVPAEVCKWQSLVVVGC